MGSIKTIAGVLAALVWTGQALVGCAPGPHRAVSPPPTAPRTADAKPEAAPQTSPANAPAAASSAAPAPAATGTPAPLAPEAQKHYRAALRRGRGLHKQADFAGAIKAFEEALAAKPEDATALSELGWSAFQDGEFLRARVATERAIERADAPRIKAASLYNLGRIEEAENNKQAAKQAYERSLALRENAAVRERLAQVETDMNLPDVCANLAGKTGKDSAERRMLLLMCGHYRVQVANEDVDGNDIDSEDWLLVVPQADGSAYVELHLNFYNGHTCDAGGIARVKETSLVFVLEDDDSPPESSCRVELEWQEDQVHIDADGAACNDYCGTRGNLSGAEFPMSSRHGFSDLDAVLESIAP